MRRIFTFFTMLAIFFAVPLFLTDSYADSRSWDGGGDDTVWADSANWHPSGIPVSSDDVTIDTEGTSVLCERTFKAKTITIGGREGSTLTSDDFIFGTIEPDAVTEVAILNRRGGHIILKGAGTITLKGQYRDSEAVIGAEPGFIFWVE